MKGQNWREPFFKIHDEIWSVINARNLRIPFQEGFFQREIFAFSEKPVREALLNAVTHRDYTLGTRSIFINATPLEFVIESPGGFLPGITPENVLYKREWRNRCIAETFERAGLVERSGQGMDDIFETTIREGKGLPDLFESDDFSVRLKIPAQVKEASRKKTDAFLKKILQCTEHPFDSVGYGRDYRYEGKKIVGSALVHENTVIHMTFFQITETEKAGRMSPVSRRRAYRTSQ